MSPSSAPRYRNPSGGPRKPRRRLPTDWGPAFLKELERTGNVSAAARKARVWAFTFYYRRLTDPDFARAAAEALEVACDALELEASHRAEDGYRRPVCSGGQLAGHISVYSDKLLLHLLQAHRPEKYPKGVKFRDTGTVSVGGSLCALTDEQLLAIINEGKRHGSQ